MKHLVRELSPSETPNRAAKTGDVLPDGSVLLWNEDMSRMGLDALRAWLQSVVERHSVIAIASKSRLTPWFRTTRAPHDLEQKEDS